MPSVQTISSSEQGRLDGQVEEYRVQLAQEHASFEAHYKEESERLGEQIRQEHESRMKLRTVSVGSSAGLSLSNNGSTVDSLELSREGEQEGEGEKEEEESEGKKGEGEEVEGEGGSREDGDEGEREKGEGEKVEGEGVSREEEEAPETSVADEETKDDGER